MAIFVGVFSKLFRRLCLSKISFGWRVKISSVSFKVCTIPDQNLDLQECISLP